MAFYPLTLEPDDGTVLVTSKAFPELITFGADRAEALFHAQDALFEALAARIAHDEDIPAPSANRPKGECIEVPPMLYLKAALYMLLRSEGKTRADLMRDLGWNRESVDRLFRLDHQSKLDNLQAAFNALGQSFRFEAPWPTAKVAA